MNRSKNVFPIELIMLLSVLALCLVSGPTVASSAEPTGLSMAQRLNGKWVRRDAPYRLAITDIGPNGAMHSSYFNPRSIHVHEANWTIQENRVHLFIEFQDTHYPGSRYLLRYIKEKDALEGEYFHAIQNTTYDVAFVRMPAQ
ncbi:hypothetical protein [Desulfoluna spongiiphila]|uniref:Uncharacterized protein n=1 Tax=Desulfoluna spongiiphila TaxID=419481 RepID=A0A1G5HCQ3_9BACT|nr:hypothetical protein [Desulfoluna spongiiphila]SCY61461.1 hypothetical protein SAMN05216233_11394 [Desulfoluna spongiiphila]